MSTDKPRKRMSEPRKRMSAEQRRAVIEEAATEVFAAHGYQRASMEEIARRSGVSVPVVYDHFSSKRQLHRRLLERHFAELRRLWRERLPDPGTAGAPGEPRTEEVTGAFDAWFGYIETHPYAWRMLFRDTTGDAAVRADHQAVIAESREALLPFFARLVGIPFDETSDEAPDEDSRIDAEMAWEVCRSVLQGLALWWLDRPQVPRERVVAAAVDAVWTGFERAGALRRSSRNSP
ncbi:TetR/AcrR family transcriptional regulator [Streptomyces spirodelae]|uniref:TetR/AcrR family transcriptional regulator n=1 Tax=Streptomyces spirodelae TaxID=2812904 RepID=A0ABS3WZZ9_9ACTN|nr:TetR/AcrR family transcriptional regulator [Streptomyces spirodelae]MBO8188697.1 TetR/AcrR family transcriptional regulator [Streptomyces spirodelae]